MKESETYFFPYYVGGVNHFHILRREIIYPHMNRITSFSSLFILAPWITKLLNNNKHIVNYLSYFIMNGNSMDKNKV
jgi:hypothetical protein